MKRSIICFLAATLALGLTAQEQTHHEVSIYGAGGLSTLRYDLSAGDYSSGFGGNFGVGYMYFFNPQWSLGTGVEISVYNSKADLPDFSTRYQTNDGTRNFYFQSQFSGYEEKQRAVYANIPLMLQYQTKSKSPFFIAAGGKIGFPMDASYNTSASSLVNSGYYPQFNLTLYNPAYMGFGTYYGEETSGDYDLETNYMASLELGKKFFFNQGLALYAGIYGDYGFNDLYKGVKNKQMLTYNTLSPTEFTHNSLFSSSYVKNGKTNEFIDNVHPWAAGIKLRLAFGIGKPIVKEEKPVQPSEAEMAAIAEAERAKQELAEANRRAELAEERARKEREDYLDRLRKEEKKREQDKEKEILAEPVCCFDLTKTELTLPIVNELNKKISILQKYPTLKFTLAGYACNLGTDEINYRLSTERAEVVKTYLIEHGNIDGDRISVEGKGSNNPVAPNDTEANRTKNRRVEFTKFKN